MTYVVINTDGIEIVASFDNEREADLFADGCNLGSGTYDGYVVAVVPELYQVKDR